MSLFEELKSDYKKYLSFREYLEKTRHLIRQGDFSSAYDTLAQASHLKFDTDRDADYHYLAGLVCLALKKPAESISHFEHCAGTEDRPQPFYYQGLAYAALGAAKTAADFFVLAAKDKPVHPDVYYRLGLSCLEQNDAEAAKTEFAKCVSMEPADDVYRYELAVATFRNGGLLEFPDDAGVESAFLPMRLHFLAIALKNGQWDDAQRMASQFGENKPPRLHFFQGIMAHETGDFHNALDAFEKSLEKAPIFEDEIRVRLKSRFRGKILSGVPEDATLCEEAFVLDELVKRYHGAVVCDKAEVWERTGDVHAARGFFNDGVAAYESCLKAASSDTVCVKLSLIFILRKQYAEAIRAIRQSTGPDAVPWQTLIETHCAAEQGGPFNTAPALNEKIGTETAAYDAMWHLTLGKVCYGKNENDPAIDCFIQAKRVCKDRFSPFSFYVFLGKEAEACLKQAYALKPVPDSGRIGTRADAGLHSLLSRTDALFKRNRYDACSSEIANIIKEYDRPLLVVVAGEFNAGKSTFINAMLGREIVPCGIRPTTATINVLKYGPDPKIRVHFENGLTKTDGIARLEGYAKHSSTGDDFMRIDFVEIFLPEPKLQSVNIVDTPGFNSEYERHDRVSEEYLKKSDAVIWLFSADRAGTLSEFGTMGPLRDHVKKTVAVINKTDIVRKKGEIERLVESVASKAGKYVSAIQTVSAGQALSGKLDNDETLLASSGWHALEFFLENELFSDQKDVKYASTRNKLRRLYASAEPSVENAVEKITADMLAFRALEETVLSNKRKTDRFAIPKYKVTVAGVFARVREITVAEISAAIVPPKSLLDFATVPKEDRRIITETLKKEMAHRLEHEIGEAARQDICEMGGRIITGMNEFLSRADFPDTDGFQNAFGESVRGMEEFFPTLLITAGAMYFKGFVDSGLTDRVVSTVCRDRKHTEPDRIREILATALADPEKMAEQTVETGFKKWSESYFHTIGDAISKIRHRLERREYDVNDGLRRPLIELRKEADALPASRNEEDWSDGKSE